MITKMTEKLTPPPEDIYKAHRLEAEAVSEAEARLYDAHARAVDDAQPLQEASSHAKEAVKAVVNWNNINLRHREHEVVHVRYAEGVARSRGYLESDPDGYQREALGAARKAGVPMEEPINGIFEVVATVKAIPAAERETLKPGLIESV